MSKTITIDPALSELPTLSWEALKKTFEPNLLKAEKRDIADLKESILTLGFFAPFHIWREGKYIIDGTGRYQALAMLEYEGYEIPPLPYISVSAKNKKEAKQKTLAISSNYGNITQETYSEFVIDLQDVDLGFISLTGVDMDKVKDPAPIKGKKEREKGETKLVHTCPACGHEFN